MLTVPIWSNKTLKHSLQKRGSYALWNNRSMDSLPCFVMTLWIEIFAHTEGKMMQSKFKTEWCHQLLQTNYLIKWSRSNKWPTYTCSCKLFTFTCNTLLIKNAIAAFSLHTLYVLWHLRDTSTPINYLAVAKLGAKYICYASCLFISTYRLL